MWRQFGLLVSASLTLFALLFIGLMPLFIPSDSKTLSLCDCERSVLKYTAFETSFKWGKFSFFKTHKSHLDRTARLISREPPGTSAAPVNTITSRLTSGKQRARLHRRGGNAHRQVGPEKQRHASHGRVCGNNSHLATLHVPRLLACLQCWNERGALRSAVQLQKAQRNFFSRVLICSVLVGPRGSPVTFSSIGGIG